VQVPKKKDQPARQANCEIKVAQMTMNPPRNHVTQQEKKLPNLNLYALSVVEKNAPGETDPIEWLLLTTLQVDNFEQAVEKIEWYCLRWRIEIFHKILKSGLHVEECRLAQANRLIRYLALMSVVAWHIFWITLIARSTPSISCELAFSNLEWKILFKAVNPHKTIPQHPPSMAQCVKGLAQLGGFLARKQDKDPGITHTWRGIKKFVAMLEGVEMARDICG